jgi:hypothetical protein
MHTEMHHHGSNAPSWQQCTIAAALPAHASLWHCQAQNAPFHLSMHLRRQAVPAHDLNLVALALLSHYYYYYQYRL